MRVAILCDKRPSFIRPMAEGLARMLKDCGAEPVIFYDGLENLSHRQSIDTHSLRSVAGSALRLRNARRSFNEFVERLRGVDLIVVVLNVPASFSRAWAPNIERLREIFPTIPIVNYDLHYLPLLYSWSRHLLRGEPTQLPPEDLAIFSRGAFGLERFDWYLMSSLVVCDVAMPPGPQPVTTIGLDLDDGTLYPDQQERFVALVDFEQPRGEFPQYREVQLEALRRTGTEYIVLDRQYSAEEIRSIYRRCSIYFLASSESFGLPICELQACGCLVFTPDPLWTWAHWLTDYCEPGGKVQLSTNFVVYENDADALAERVRDARLNANPAAVRETFLNRQPHLFRGDRAALGEFLQRVQNGEIHSQRHKEHAGIGRA